MGTSVGEYSILAQLFAYPDAGFAAQVTEVQEFLDASCAEASGELREFSEFASGASLVELEELYTRSFDVQAITTLDLGYVLFGDDYKRGELLVNLNREHREAGVDCGGELPDHLPNILRLLDAMEGSELRDELVEKIVGPALRKIIGEFDAERVEKKNAAYAKHYKTLIERSQKCGDIYAGPLRAVYAVLRRDFDVGIERDPAEVRENRFLNSIGTELKLECNEGNCHGSIE